MMRLFDYLVIYAFVQCSKSWVNENATDQNLFEGDIILDPDDENQIIFESEDSDDANIQNVATENRLWPNGTIPYKISDRFSKSEKSLIEAIMLEFHHFTCIRFHRRTMEANYIHILKDSFFCRSRVGYQGRMQKVSLKEECLTRNTVLHELMHVLGFWHEQSRYDRDDYIEILTDNIEEKSKNNFLKYHQQNVTHSNTPYDFHSVMHYGIKDFSKNGFPTIRVRPHGVQIKQDGLSVTDKLEINILYKCISDERLSTQSTSDTLTSTMRYRTREQRPTFHGCPQTIPRYYNNSQLTYPICAIAFSEWNCGGNKLYIPIWQGNLGNEIGQLNEISSAQINPGCTLKLCTETSYTGHCIVSEGGETGKNLFILLYPYNNGVASLMCTCGNERLSKGSTSDTQRTVYEYSDRWTVDFSFKKFHQNFKNNRLLCLKNMF